MWPPATPGPGRVQPGSSAKPSPTDSTSTASVTMCSHLFGDLFVDLDFHPGLLVAELPLAPYAPPLAQYVEAELSLPLVDPSYLEGVLDRLRVQ